MSQAAVTAGRGGLNLAWRRLRRNPAGIASAVLFAAILFACFPGAPLWVSHVCHHSPNDQNIQGYISSGGHRVPVVANDGTPIGPGWRACYILGADANGRDLFVRILYGGRVSLESASCPPSYVWAWRCCWGSPPGTRAASPTR